MQSAQFKASREFCVFFFFPVLVSNGQFYFRLIRLGPAEDCLLLVSSRPDGHCCVETANLDGETNLKKKAAAMTSEEFHAARFQWSDELNMISTYFKIHLSCWSIYQIRMRLGTVGGLGLDARPVFCVKRPTETCTPLKAHCVTWKNWTETKTETVDFFDSETMWNSYFMIFVHMS